MSPSPEATSQRRMIIAHRVYNAALLLTVIGAMVYVAAAGVLPTELEGN
jgi:hypothetical protein